MSAGWKRRGAWLSETVHSRLETDPGATAVPKNEPWHGAHSPSARVRWRFVKPCSPSWRLLLMRPAGRRYSTFGSKSRSGEEIILSSPCRITRDGGSVEAVVFEKSLSETGHCLPDQLSVRSNERKRVTRCSCCGPAFSQLRVHLPDFFASAAASSLNLAMVAGVESLRLLLFCLRLAFVV